MTQTLPIEQPNFELLNALNRANYYDLTPKMGLKTKSEGNLKVNYQNSIPKPSLHTTSTTIISTLR